MRVAVIGSRTLVIDNLEEYLPCETTQIVTGGAKGIDTSARMHALKKGIPLQEYLPEYKKYGRAAPLKRKFHAACL